MLLLFFSFEVFFSVLVYTCNPHTLHLIAYDRERRDLVVNLTVKSSIYTIFFFLVTKKLLFKHEKEKEDCCVVIWWRKKEKMEWICLPLSPSQWLLIPPSFESFCCRDFWPLLFFLIIALSFLHPFCTSYFQTYLLPFLFYCMSMPWIASIILYVR